MAHQYATVCWCRADRADFRTASDLALARRFLKMPAFVLGLLGPQSASATHRDCTEDYLRMAVVDVAAQAAEAASLASRSRTSSHESDDH